MNITVLDHEYPLAYTIAAQSKIAEHFGSLEKMSDIMQSAGAAENVDHIIYLAAVMMSAYSKRERAKASLMGEQCDVADPPSYEQLIAVLENDDVIKIAQAVGETIKASQKSKIEIEPEKRGKGVATQSK